VASKPKILLVVTLAEVGGAQSYVRELVPGLTGDLDVTVAAYGPGPLGDAVRASGARFVPLRHVRRPLSPVRDVLGLFELWRLCHALAPDIVHANSSKAGILARLAAVAARVPVRVFTAHGWAFKAAPGRAARLYLAADRLVRPLTSAVVCVSEAERAAGIAARTCDAARTVVIHNGVDAGRAPQHVERDDGVMRIVSVGRLAAPKDFLTLIRATARLDPARVRVTVLGDGPDRPQLEAEIARLGLAGVVELAGEVDDVPQRLAGADVFVLSSRSEGLPVSVLEAMAAGLPVVATDVGGLRELVEDGAGGLLVPPGDVDSLAARLDALLADPALRRRLGGESRRRAQEKFSIHTFRAAHLDLYRRLLDRPVG